MISTSFVLCTIVQKALIPPDDAYRLRCCAETAENIGYSCNMLREEMTEVFVIAADTPEEVRKELV